MSNYTDAVLQAHRVAATENHNPSSLMVRLVASVGGTFPQALQAAITTLGETHGPVSQARRVLFGDLNESIELAVIRGMKVPGWGNSFFKGPEGDPAWKEAAEVLEKEHPKEHAILKDATGRVSMALDRDDNLAPNAAAYTAVCAELLNLPMGTEMSIFVEARTAAWTLLYADAYEASRLLGSS